MPAASAAPDPLAVAGAKSPKPTSPPVPAPGSVLALIAEVRLEFEKGQFGKSGLAGAFREPTQQHARQSYLAAVETLYDLIYLLGEVFTQFHCISDGLGDYGMIRVSTWLHPFLETIMEKVQRLRGNLEGLNEAVDSELVLAKARGRKVKKPAPTEYMSSRAHAAIDRAISSRDCHANMLLQAFEELRARSAPERLPHVMEGVSDACTQLQKVLSSPQFRSRVGDSFPELQPLPVSGASSGSFAAITGVAAL